jgi:small-conductance mechanosensitive channel
LTSAAIALAGNLVVLVVARLTGADMLVQRDQATAPMTIGVVPVALTTVAPTLLATALLQATRRRGPRAWRALAVAGLVVGIVTVPAPFTLLAETSTRVPLALMHVITGAVWFTVVRRAAARGGQA